MEDVLCRAFAFHSSVKPVHTVGDGCPNHVTSYSTKRTEKTKNLTERSRICRGSGEKTRHMLYISAPFQTDISKKSSLFLTKNTLELSSM